MTTRIYRVNDYLVEAGNQHQAVHHIARATIECRVATQRDIVELRDMGVPVQRAGGQYIPHAKGADDPGGASDPHEDDHMVGTT